MQLPLVLTLRRSRRFGFLLSTIHLLAVAALLPLALPWAARLVLAIAVLLSLFATRSTLRRQEGVVLHLGPRGAMELTPKVGAGGTVSVDADTALLPGLIVLVLRREGKRLVLPLFPDSVGAEDFRRLRLWLRARGKDAVSSAA